MVDGLNEAEDPRDWKPLLASLHEVLGRYPYVPHGMHDTRWFFLSEAIPEDVPKLEIPDFGDATAEAIRAYFKYYTRLLAYPVDTDTH